MSNHRLGGSLSLAMRPRAASNQKLRFVILIAMAATIAWLGITALPDEPQQAPPLATGVTNTAPPLRCASQPEANQAHSAVIPTATNSPSLQCAPRSKATPQAAGQPVSATTSSTTAETEAFHQHASEGQIAVPCETNNAPSHPSDARCVARWATFQLIAGSPLANPWIHQALTPNNPEGEKNDVRPVEVLVLDHDEELDQVGPGRAQIRVALERSWATGQTEHLFFAASLRLVGTHWQLVSLERR